MPGNSLLYSDIDPNVIELLYRRFKTPIEQLIDNKLQRRQLWGPTFKQEDIYECALPDADFRIPEPENGKRTWIFTGTLTATRVIRVPPIVSAWWFVFNKTEQPLTFLIDPAGTVGPTILAGALGAIITDGEEIFGLTGGDSGTGTGDGVPGGTPTQLQYKLDATTFGGATGSSVSGANIGMGGTLTVALAPKSIRLDPVSQEFPFIQFDRTGPDIFNSNSGAIAFRGNRGGIPTQSGYLRSYYNEFFGLTMEMGVETGATRIAVEETASVKAATMNSGSHYFQVESAGLRTSEGAGGAMLYQDGPVGLLYLKALEIGTENQVLKVTDIGGGVLRPRWGAGVTAGLTPPGGTATQIQFHSATDTFEGITGTAVNGRTITLGGDTHIIDTVAHSFYFQRTTDVLHAEGVGSIIFREFLPGDIETRFGYLAGYRDDTYVADNQVLELGQTIMRRIHIDKGALSLDYDNQFIQLRADGIRISGGVQGAFFYQEGAPPTGPIYTPLPIGAANTYLKSDGTRPLWAVIPASTPGGTPTQIQFHSATGTFEGITGSAVNGRTVTLGGDTHIIDTVSHALYFQRSTDVLDAQAVGSIIFREYLPGDIETRFGYLIGYRDDTYVADNQVLELGQTIMRRIHIDKAALNIDYDDQFIQLRATGIRVSVGLQGAILYQNTHGGADLFLDPLAIDPTGTKWLKSNGSAPVWATLPAGTVTTPGGSPTQLQFHATGGTFGGITGSAVTGADITLGGNVAINDTVDHRLDFRRTTTPADGGYYGSVWFKLNDTELAVLRCIQTSAGPLADFALSAATRVYLEATASGMDCAGKFIQLQTGGVRLSVGTQGSLLYQNSHGGADLFLDPLLIGAANTYLKSTGTAPSWSAIGWSDISGVLPISKGGTGTGTPPTSGQLLIGKADGSYALSTLTEDTGILITEGDGTITIKCTISPGAGATPPGGSATQIQFHNTDDTFAGITGSSVSGANIGLGGNITISDTSGHELYFSRTTVAAHAQLLGQVAFRDASTGVATAKHVLRSYWVNTGAGYIFEMWATDARRLYVSDIAAGIDFDSHFIQLQSGGIRWSVGTAGSLFYQGTGTPALITALPITSSANKWLRSNGTIPGWQTITAADGSITIAEVGGGITIKSNVTGGTTSPGDPVSGLQWNNANTFDGMDGSVVTGSDLQLGGNLTFQRTHPAFSTIAFRGTGTDATHGVPMGRIAFVGVRSSFGATPFEFGFLSSYWDTSGLGTVVRLGAYNAVARVEINDDRAGAHGTAIFANSDLVYFKVWSGGIRMSLGTGVGAMYYKTSTSFGDLGALELGGANKWMRTNSGNTAPSWQTIAAADSSITIAEVAGGITIKSNVTGSATPGSPVNTLQWNSASTFAAVANSNVTAGGLITLQEQSSTLGNALLTLQKTAAAGANLTNGHSVGKILFQGLLSGVQSDFGILEGLYNTTPLRTLRLGQGVLSAGNAYRVIALKDSGEIGMEVSNSAQTTILKLDFTGMILTPGSGSGFFSNGTYYRNSSGYFQTTTAGGTNQYFKTASSSGPPAWAALSADDISLGTLAPARGGTGNGAPSLNGQLLIGNSSGGYTLARLTQGSNITITYPSSGAIQLDGPTASTPAGQLRGSKALSNGSMTTLMQILFGVSEQTAASGWIDLFFVAKRSSPSADVQTHRRIIAFAVSHSRSSLGSYHFKEIAVPTALTGGGSLSARVTQRVTTDTAAVGFNDLSQQINSDTATELGVEAINNTGSFNTFQFKVSATSPFSLTSLTLHYNITFNGDAPVTAV